MRRRRRSWVLSRQIIMPNGSRDHIHGTPVYHPGTRKSALTGPPSFSAGHQNPDKPWREIRCQFIILARKDEPTSRQEARERRIAEA